MVAHADSRGAVPRVVGRYALYGEIAAGGMATVHVGRLLGAAGFSRTVAIKRLHPQFANDPEFVAMFLDEARLAARIKHPNVVPTLDVVAEHDQLFVVMEYVHGESLARAWRTLTARGQRIPPKIAAAAVVGALHGLHAAHEARDEQGRPLDVVHRDVSPQNILLGADGVARVLDFGVAKAAGRSQQTREGQLKGKLAYMAPEQFRREPVTRSVDVYAASIVLWETLTGRRLFAADSEAAVVENILYGSIQPASEIAPELPPGVDAVLARGLARAPGDRFATAQDLAVAVEGCLGVASPMEVGAWLAAVAGEALDKRAAMVATVEASGDPSSASAAPPLAAPTTTTSEDTVAKAPVTLTRTRTSARAGAAHDETKAEGGADEGRRGRPWTLVAGGALAIAVVAAIGVVRARSGATTAVADAPPTASAAAQAAPSDSAAPQASSPPPPAAPSSSTAAPAGSDSPPSRLHAVAPSPRPVAAPAAHPRHPTHAPGPSSAGRLPRGLPTERD